MINKSESIHRYLNAHLKKRWTIIYYAETGSDWIIDIKNKYWIVELKKNGVCWCEGQVYADISELYEIIDARSIIGEWVKEIIKREITIIGTTRIKPQSVVKRIIKRGIKK